MGWISRQRRDWRRGHEASIWYNLGRAEAQRGLAPNPPPLMLGETLMVILVETAYTRIRAYDDSTKEST